MKKTPNIFFDHMLSLVLVTGISGAGKSTAIDTLSDLGFFCIENLPVPLFPGFLQLSLDNPGRFRRTALNLDIDSREKQEQLITLLGATRSPAEKLRIIFLDCRTEVIVRRYGETRRPHPGFDPAKDKTLEDAIFREKRRLFPMRELANLTLDTSDFNLHDLHREIRTFIESETASSPKAVRLNFLSFGFKYGLPIDCDLLIDVRFLPNPFFAEGLNEQSGLQTAVVDYVLENAAGKEFIARYTQLLHFLLPYYVSAGKLYLNVGVGCTGGRHRSVAVSEKLAQEMGSLFKQDQYLVSVKHRDIDKD